MFVGHFALGFAAKKVDPRPSLGTYLLAAQLADVLWPALLMAGVEHVSIVPGDTAFTPLRFDSYPVSHSLLTLALWGAAFAGLYWAVKRNGRAALLLGLLVVSHWVLDFATHRPDMPLLPWSPRVVGLGLWSSVPATLAVEIPMFAAGVWLYLGATRPRDRAGRYGAAGLVALLAVAYASSVLGPPPPSVAAIVVVGLLGAAVILALAVWVDRHRSGVVPIL